MTWIVFAIIVTATMLVLIRPLLRGAPAARGDAPDVAMYKMQLSELDRDRERGLIAEREADAARREIERRLSTATRAAETHEAQRNETAAAAANRRPLAAALVLALPLAALGVYLLSGAPNLPSAPTQARDAARQMALTPELAARIEAVRADAEAGDEAAWAALGGIYIDTRRFPEAVEALAAARRQFPDSATLAALHGEALVRLSRGFVSQAALDAFRRALTLDAEEPRARYFMGLFTYQSGRREEALQMWTELAGAVDGPDRFMATLARRIVDTATELGKEPSRYLDTRMALLVGGDVAAAAMARMSQEEREQAIAEMVERLAARLEDNPNNWQGWIQLGRSRSVLGQYAAAAEAYARADAIMPQQSVPMLMDWAGALIRAAPSPRELPAELGPVLTRVLAAEPDNQDALWFAGVVAAQARDFETARSHWSHLLTLTPEDAELRPALEQALQAVGGDL